MKTPRILRRPNKDNEASLEFISGKPTVTLGPKFFDLPRDNQKFVLSHELGHFFVWEHLRLVEISGLTEDSLDFNGVYGQFNSEEGFCDAFAEYLLTPQELKKNYPDHYEFLEKRVGDRGPWLRWVTEHHNADLENSVRYAMTKKAYKTETFDEEKVSKLRKDFLKLTRNVKKVDNFKQLMRLRKAFRTWDEHFRDYVFERLAPKLKDMGHSSLEQEIRSDAWDLHLDLSMPIRLTRMDDDYWQWTGEAVFQDFLKERDTWFRRMRRHARELWKTMRRVLEALERADVEVSLDLPEQDQLEIEGFNVLIKERDKKPDRFWQKTVNEGISKLRPGLKKYRQRASKVFPLLLQKQLPIVVETSRDLNQLAYYKARPHRIVVHVTGIDDIDHFVHVMAHEMGHHIYQTYLSDKATDFWYKAVRQSEKDLDLRDVLVRWPEGMNRTDFDEILKKEDPELFIQLESLHYKYQTEGLLFREEFEDYLRNGGDPIVRVKTGLPTSYSSKNPEEAFCETLGRLVAYGPKTVPDVAVRWMKEILPNVKTAVMAQRVATRVMFQISPFQIPPT